MGRIPAPATDGQVGVRGEGWSRPVGFGLLAQTPPAGGLGLRMNAPPHSDA